jgi:alpha-tubulin suppressor-like RCC1 family protein
MKNELLHFASGIFLLLFLSFFSKGTYAQKLAPEFYSSSSYALHVNGTLYDWGANTVGQLGDNTTIDQPTPINNVPFPSGVTSWTAVTGGGGFTLAIGNDGNMYSWGSNAQGQLGNGTTGNSTTPVMVTLPSGVTSWKAVTAGAYYIIAVGSDNNLYAWGSNVYGQLGDSTTVDRHVPTKVYLPSGVTGWTTIIGAGAFNSLAVGSDGNLYAWGWYGYNELPLGTLSASQLIPAKVTNPDGVTGWISLAGGIYTSFAIGNDGNLYSCGYNTHGQLGIGYPHTSPNVFMKAVLPVGVTGLTAVTSGANHILALGNDGNLYACGLNSTGQLGLGNLADTATLQKVALPTGITSFKAIAGGNAFSLAISDNDYVYACGQNTNGELGINNKINQSTLQEVLGVGGNGYLILGVPPPAPILLSPANNAINQSTSLTLKWAAAATATGYQCQVSTDPTFATNIIINDLALTDTTDAIKGLGNSTVYYWHVKSYSSAGYSSFSVIDTFSTIAKPPDKPVLVSPINNATNLPATDTLVCTKALGASQYHWQVRTDLNFSSVNGFVVDDSTSDTMRVVTLSSGTKYYWQVQSVNPLAASDFAGPDSFKVMVAPAVAPILLIPVNNAINQRVDTLYMKWNQVSLASGYECQLSISPSFSPLVVSHDLTNDTTFIVTNLLNLQKYYWRVRAYNAGGTSPFSVPDSLTTIIAAPSIPQLVSPVHATGVALKSTLIWRVAARAEKYEVQLATDSQLDSVGAFKTVAFDSTTTDTTLQLSTPLTANTKYYWHVSAMNMNGTSGYSNTPLYYFTTGTETGVANENGKIPTEFTLSQNYPNPFNPSTIIKYSLPKSQMVTLRVYNIIGQVVATLISAHQNAGYYDVNFNADHLTSGVYFYVLRTDNFTLVHKMLLLK